MRNLAALVLAAFALSGCATQIMSEQECFAGDWYGAGLTDGAQGLTEAAFGARAARCAEVGAPPPDGEAYIEGRNASLSRLCTDAGGYDYARSGNIYRGVCRASREADFLGGYLEGRRLFALAGARDAAQRDYDSASAGVDIRRREIREARKVIEDPEATEEEIRKARDDIEDARDALPYLRRQVEDMLYALGRADEAYAQALTDGGAWRRSDDFFEAFDMLLETHGFARDEDAIDFCTDDMLTFAPSCGVRPGAVITDSVTGRTCAAGPGDAALASRRPSYSQGIVSGRVLTFDYFPEGSGGLFGPRPRGGFDVVLDEEGETVRVACIGAP